MDLSEITSLNVVFSGDIIRLIDSLKEKTVNLAGCGEFILDPELKMDIEPGKKYDLSKIHELKGEVTLPIIKWITEVRREGGDVEFAKDAILNFARTINVNPT